MLMSRRGWVTVTLIVLFLLARSITGTVLELKLVDDRLAALRIVMLALWIALLGGTLFGLESARFLVIIILSLGTALSLAVFLDPALTSAYREWEAYPLWLDYIKFFAATNLVVIPLLAFSRPVRSYFSKMLRQVAPPWQPMMMNQPPQGMNRPPQAVTLPPPNQKVASSKFSRKGVTKDENSSGSSQ